MFRNDCMVPVRGGVFGKECYIVFDVLDSGFNAFPVWDIVVRCRTGGVKMKVEGLNHIFHIYIPYISLMIEQKSLFSRACVETTSAVTRQAPSGRLGRLIVSEVSCVFGE